MSQQQDLMRLLQNKDLPDLIEKQLLIKGEMFI